MERKQIEEIVRALNQARVEYLIVGGLAVVAHGYMRFTTDLDLVLSVNESNLRRAVTALKGLDYQPRAPVPFEEFIDAAMRKKWASEKGMRVFSLFSVKHPATEVDLFLEPPLDFPPAYERAMRVEVAPGIEATFAGFDDLIQLKQLADRPLDRDDIHRLRELRGTENQ